MSNEQRPASVDRDPAQVLMKSQTSGLSTSTGSQMLEESVCLDLFFMISLLMSELIIVWREILSKELKLEFVVLFIILSLNSVAPAVLFIIF